VKKKANELFVQLSFSNKNPLPLNHRAYQIRLEAVIKNLYDVSKQLLGNGDRGSLNVELYFT
jgi:hypothetical protein